MCMQTVKIPRGIRLAHDTHGGVLKLIQDGCSARCLHITFTARNGDEPFDEPNLRDD